MLDGAKILRETWGINELVPLYDNEDSVCGILYNQVPYYFRKNLQGDIIAITDKYGETVARYTYDAWGKCAIVDLARAHEIATINPFRYRGYYYDSETALYYLQSRYYDPTLGRFINADGYVSTGQQVIENNMFAYSNNDSVNHFDPTGEDAIWLQDSTNVFSMGHTGLLLEDNNGKCYHFYWGNNRNGKKRKSGSGKILLQYYGKLTLSAINTFYNYHYQNKYEFMIRFKGDFSKAVAYAKNLESKTYNLLANNCMEVTTDVLRKGTFSQSNAAYKTFLLKLRTLIVPNIAYNRMVRFHAAVKNWHATPWFWRKPANNPLVVATWL